MPTNKTYCNLCKHSIEMDYKQGTALVCNKLKKYCFEIIDREACSFYEYYDFCSYCKNYEKQKEGKCEFFKKYFK